MGRVRPLFFLFAGIGSISVVSGFVIGEYVRLEEESVVSLLDLLLDTETGTSLGAELEYTGVRSGSLCWDFPSVSQMVIFSSPAVIARASELVINLFWVWIVGLFV